MIEVNLNNYVYCKVNELGRIAFHEYYLKFNLHQHLSVNEGGYARLQLHEFLSIFGPMFESQETVPVSDMNVIIEPNTQNIEVRRAVSEVIDVVREVDEKLPGIKDSLLNYFQNDCESFKKVYDSHPPEENIQFSWLLVFYAVCWLAVLGMIGYGVWFFKR